MMFPIHRFSYWGKLNFKSYSHYYQRLLRALQPLNVKFFGSKLANWVIINYNLYLLDGVADKNV